MVAEESAAPSPLREGGNPDAFVIPIKYLAICGNDHGYDASRSPACPACGNFERIMVDLALGPQILHRRILAALVSLTAPERRR